MTSLVKLLALSAVFSFQLFAQPIYLGGSYQFTMCFVDSGGHPFLGTIQFAAVAQAMSGYHAHSDGSRPNGTLEYQTVNTFANGCATNSFYATDIAGTHQLIGYPQPYGTPATIYVNVEYSGLVEIPATSPNYQRVGAQPEHPNGFWATQNAVTQIQVIAQQFRMQSGMVMGINDASLQWGGRFDLGPRYGSAFWGPAHSEHEVGLNVDCPFQYLDPYRTTFKTIATANGGNSGQGIFVEGNHYHLRFAY